MNHIVIKLFLRLAISIGFLSAVADRFGIWSKEVSVFSASAGAFALSLMKEKHLELDNVIYQNKREL